MNFFSLEFKIRKILFHLNYFQNDHRITNNFKIIYFYEK
jgi:hypothetical protein